MRMERLGMQRAAIFSWDRTAARTLDLYYEVAGNPSRAPAHLKKRASAALP